MQLMLPIREPAQSLHSVRKVLIVLPGFLFSGGFQSIFILARFSHKMHPSRNASAANVRMCKERSFRYGTMEIGAHRGICGGNSSIAPLNQILTIRIRCGPNHIPGLCLNCLHLVPEVGNQRLTLNTHLDRKKKGVKNHEMALACASSVCH